MQETSQSKAVYWQAKVADFKRSGLSRAAYCRAHDLKLTTFKNWCYRSRRAGAEKTDKPNRFVPLLTSKGVAAASTPSTAYYYVHLKQAIRLDIPISIPLTELGHLLRLVGAL